MSTCDVRWYELCRRTSPWIPAWFLGHRRSDVPWRGRTAAAVVTAPDQRGAVWAAGRRGWRRRRVSDGPQSKDWGGGFIVIQLSGGWLQEPRTRENVCQQESRNIRTFTGSSLWGSDGVCVCVYQEDKVRSWWCVVRALWRRMSEGLTCQFGIVQLLLKICVTETKMTKTLASVVFWKL